MLQITVWTLISTVTQKISTLRKIVLFGGKLIYFWIWVRRRTSSLEENQMLAKQMKFLLNSGEYVGILLRTPNIFPQSLQKHLVEILSRLHWLFIYHLHNVCFNGFVFVKLNSLLKFCVNFQILIDYGLSEYADSRTFLLRNVLVLDFNTKKSCSSI